MSDESIRPYQDVDELAVTNVWYRSATAAFAFLPNWQSLTFDQAQSIFREVILPRCEIWVGIDNNNVVAFLAMNDS